jgi:2-hydroxychromene-2-carboxylate isomerase
MNRPRLYFSFRSPYSWMSVERLRRAGVDPHRTLEYIPYWDPDPNTESALRERGGDVHYVQMSKAKHLYILHDTKREAARLGLTMRWPIDINPHWEVPHLGFLIAQRQGAEAAFYTEAVAARWERGENICEPDVIGEVAERAGLDGAELARATDDQTIRAVGVECLWQAYMDDIFGIPYFRIGPHRFWGLDRVDAAVSSLAGRTVSLPEPVTVGGSEASGYDSDTAGGCG